LQLQDVVLLQVQQIRRIGSVALGPQPLPGRGVQYTRQLSTNGDMYEVSGYGDRVTVEQIFALSGTVWVSDPDLGSFHAIVEVDASWLTALAPHIESTS
jgi:hypothetical protein